MHAVIQNMSGKLCPMFIFIVFEEICKVSFYIYNSFKFEITHRNIFYLKKLEHSNNTLFNVMKTLFFNFDFSSAKG